MRSGWCLKRGARPGPDRVGAPAVGRAPTSGAHEGQDGPDDGGPGGIDATAQGESPVANGPRDPRKSRGLLCQAPGVKFAWIAAEKACFPVTALCRNLGVSPTGFYAWQRRPESVHAREDRRLKALIHTSFTQSRRNYGSPRVHDELIEWQERLSRKRVARLMREDGLVARVRRRYKHTTLSDHDQPVADNVLARTFTAAAPNQRWVGDTTEFVIGTSSTIYLATILDLFSRYVVGWAVSPSNDRHLTMKALDMAPKRRGRATGMLFHSDQGSPYASEDYQGRLAVHGITCSMSRRGNCYDNAVMESFFSTVKSELADQFASFGDAKMELFDYIEVFYNQQRRHSSAGRISPAAYEKRYVAMTQAA